MKFEFNWSSGFREDVVAGVTGILLTHQIGFGSGELKNISCNKIIFNRSITIS